MKPLACGMYFFNLYKLVYYTGLAVFIGSNILYSISYRNIGKKSYRYISNPGITTGGGGTQILDCQALYCVCNNIILFGHY